MSEREKIIGEIRTGNPIKFEKEELDELKKEIDTDKLINAGKLVEYHDDTDDTLLTEEDEMYWFDQFHSAFITATTLVDFYDSSYNENVCNMCRSIHTLYRHFETCSDEPMFDIHNRLISNYGAMGDIPVTVNTLLNAALYVRRSSVYGMTSLYSLLYVYASNMTATVRSMYHNLSFSELIRDSYMGTNFINLVIAQCTSILFESYDIEGDLVNTFERMNDVVTDTSMIIAIEEIDKYVKELEDGGHELTEYEGQVIDHYITFCEFMRELLQETPFFTRYSYLYNNSDENTNGELPGSDETDEYSAMRLTINEYSDIITENDYPIENVIDYIMKELTHVGSCYSSQLVGDAVCPVFTKDSPEIENIITYVDIGTLEDTIALLEKFYSMDFTDDDVYRAYEFSLIQLKLGMIIDILKTTIVENEIKTQSLESLNRDTVLYSYYTKLSKMLRDIADILISTQNLTEFPTDVVLWKLKTFYCQYELDNYNFDTIHDYIKMMEDYINESYERLNNAYDISIYQISLSYINYIKLLLDFDDDYHTGDDDECENDTESDNNNTDYYSVTEDIATYAGAIGHFTNVLTEVMTNKLSLVDPMGIRISSCDRNYVNIMKGLLSIEEDMSVDKGISVSAFRCVMIDYIPTSHLENLRTRVMRHDPSSSEYDESLNIVCKETFQHMINIIDKDLAWFLDQVKDKYFGEEVVCAMFKTNMQAYYNIIQLFKDSYDNIVH